MDRKTLGDELRDSAHEIRCADRSALAAAYDVVAQTPWIEGCDVDLPGLRLVLRLAARPPAGSDAAARWLVRVERTARGRR